MRFLVLAASLAAGSPSQTSVEAPPAVLAPYIHGDAFEPGDYHWLRGQFDGANATEKADDLSLFAWRKRCRASDMARTRADLAEMGIKAGASLDRIPYRTLICDQIATLPEAMDRHDWNGFAHDVASVRPIAQGFLAAVALAERGAAPDTSVLSDQLNSRSVGEQILRRGLDWANGGGADAPAPNLTPRQRGILISIIAMAMDARDHANTEWLKAIVASQGWPTRRKVGGAAASVAWLLVQHADADPAFQAQALRLMEPYVATGEVEPKNYAYLYDRVMLKIVGKQRYGSQLTCRAGHYVPQPVEDDSKVDSWRRQVGLEPLVEYEQRVDKEVGCCNEVPAGS